MTKSKTNIVNVLYAIDCINKHQVEFQYDDEADEVFCDYLNKIYIKDYLYKRLIKKSHGCTGYFG